MIKKSVAILNVVRSLHLAYCDDLCHLYHSSESAESCIFVHFQLVKPLRYPSRHAIDQESMILLYARPGDICTSRQ